MPAAVLEQNFARAANGANVLIAEGSMGLFDGVAATGASGDGSSADIAARFRLPVVLVVDAGGMSQSVGAVAAGFSQFRPEVKIAGVILGNIASERHFALATLGVEKAGIKVFGHLPRGAVPPLPERHLGLVQAGETPDACALIDKLADAVEKHIDVEGILSSCHPALVAGSRKMFTDNACYHRPRNKCGMTSLGIKKIALARDVAFSFTYPHILAQWREAGVEILPFSPLADEAPDPAADLCWLAGGYPELHAQKLSEARRFMQGLRDFAAKKPVHGECGGYMVLGDAIIDADGNEWKMSGLLPLSTSFAQRKLHLGYRALRLAVDAPIGERGELVRGHEFHYATISAMDMDGAQSLGDMIDANGISLGSAGMQVGNVTGTFFHLVAGE